MGLIGRFGWCVSVRVGTGPDLVACFYRVEPTSAPLDLFIEDKNDTSVSIIWSQPETVGDSGLDGYLIEVCKDGSKSTSPACYDYRRVQGTVVS